MTDSIALIISSVASHEDARHISRHLIEHQLAACVQISETSSCYRWQGAIVQEQESLLHIKTLPALADMLITWLAQHHPYDTPEILLLDASANTDYARWVAGSCRSLQQLPDKTTNIIAKDSL